ncbi:MAG: hypothetical protein DWQ47_03530 [Acidobacteria bacterium]|nr:MAG: hypothetical protein DWQ32_07080 [Acidobacteriota bacterium]REK01472.1 MAG: hypothetical protein DWQ38_03515 [Acidobacteriota bacterium]REK14428.1 MAG: hypothetical protein DWQ43_12770 [Acidobacteriota bacterium]REK45143.1 MAG: hypothetical protein DWQ47_03530 [Acidobacteriota bacterium]
MKFFVDYSALRKGKIKNLIPILKFHWLGLDKQAIFSGRTNPDSRIELTEDPREANFVLLPMHWSYYLWNDKENFTDAEAAAELAARFNKNVVVWYQGDLVPKVPFDNAIVFLPGIVGNETEQLRACPVFIDDPSEDFGRRSEIYRSWKETPEIGFCGFSASGPVKQCFSVVQGLRLSLLSSLGYYDYDNVPVIPSTVLRTRVLRRLEESELVDTNFIKRSRYTPKTVTDSGNPGEMRTAFFDNLYGSDYSVCVRGYGNWSYRFYETLACGRIPIFINTDCVLPLSSSIDWKKYCVWIERSEIDEIVERILDFHSSFDEEGFIALQVELRKIWEEQFTLGGMMANLESYL